MTKEIVNNVKKWGFLENSFSLHCNWLCLPRCLCQAPLQFYPTPGYSLILYFKMKIQMSLCKQFYKTMMSSTLNQNVVLGVCRTRSVDVKRCSGGQVEPFVEVLCEVEGHVRDLGMDAGPLEIFRHLSVNELKGHIRFIANLMLMGWKKQNIYFFLIIPFPRCNLGL